MGAALLMSMLGVFMSATRINAVILFALIATSIFTGRVKAAYRFRWLVLLAVLAYGVGGDERLQRFRTLQDPEFIAQRLGDSVNMSFVDLIRKYPLGNGLGGGGTSVPYFLQSRIRNVVVMENEYARILLELGIPGLLMWVLFIGWIFTRGEIRKHDMVYLGAVAYVAVVYICDRLIGTGLLHPFHRRRSSYADRLDCVPEVRLLRRPTSWRRTWSRRGRSICAGTAESLPG